MVAVMMRLISILLPHHVDEIMEADQSYREKFIGLNTHRMLAKHVQFRNQLGREEHLKWIRH